MAYNNLKEFIELLERENEIIRISTPVNSHLEISELNDRMIKTGGKALLFEQVDNSEFPVLVNAMGTERRLELAFKVNNIEEVSGRIEKLFEILQSSKGNWWAKLKVLPQLREIASWTPKRSSKRGSCQEIEMLDTNLLKLPVLTTWPFDGGPFITFPVVHSISVEHNAHNMGMYRMQVFDKQTTGMHWHLHKGGANHYKEYKKLAKRMPVTVTLGGDPAYTYAATAPLPEEIDEYLLAGFLRKKAVKLVKCLTNDIYIPEDVDFVIEGYVDPQEDLVLEGPFGDHTGYYSLADFYPKFHVTKITHRRSAIYPATVVGIPPQEDAFIGLATEKIFLAPIKKTMIPEMVDMHMPMEGVFHNIVLNSIEKTFPGQSNKVMNALWGAGQMMFNKYLLIFDHDISLTNYKQVLKRLLEVVDPINDILISRGPMDVLDHASIKFAEGGKMGIDATKKVSFIKTTPEISKLAIEKIEQVIEINDYFINEGLGLLLIKLKKSKNIARIVANELISKRLIREVKFVVFVEAVADITEFGDLVWRVANNSDPGRDCFYVQEQAGITAACLFIDGLRKDKLNDVFDRAWPNIVCMDEETIDKVDRKWNEYKIGPFIESPSKKYRSQLYPGKETAD
jgi:4-hydroxy-3-polyprenylbenzoate decarboxylase